MSRAPRRRLTGLDMTWDRTLKKALTSVGLLTEFTKWRDLTAYREQWRTIYWS